MNANNPFMIISLQKIKDINWLFPVSLLINESFILIGWETQQVILNQNVIVSGATFPWWLPRCKKQNSSNNKKN